MTTIIPIAIAAFLFGILLTIAISKLDRESEKFVMNLKHNHCPTYNHVHLTHVELQCREEAAYSKGRYNAELMYENEKMDKEDLAMYLQVPLRDFDNDITIKPEHIYQILYPLFKR